MFFKLSDARFHSLVLRIEALEARLEALKAQHNSLRSRYYATRGTPSAHPGDRAASAPLSQRAEKDAILREVIFGGRHVPDPKQSRPGEEPEAGTRPAGSDAWDSGDETASFAGSQR